MIGVTEVIDHRLGNKKGERFIKSKEIYWNKR